MLIGTYNAQYIGKSLCGFISTHDYCINIDKDEYVYQVSGITDLTEENDSSAFITYASENSLRRNWLIKKDITKLGCD